MDRQWSLLWSSDEVCYGGDGIENPLTDAGWFLPGESAVLFKAVSMKQPQS
jgi:maltooligosyltrehalose trehalohydrolase